MSGPDRVASVIVIAKEPVAGRVKTRLTPPLAPAEAAAVAAAALSDTLSAVAGVRAETFVLAFDGDATGWLPQRWHHVVQSDGGLDLRLAAAFAAAARVAPQPGPSVLVGMDTPQLRADQLAAWDPGTHDACLGLATDGGFWAIGFSDPSIAGRALTGIPMSSDRTGAAQLERLQSLGLRVALLDTLTDVDTIASAHEVAALVPGSRFAAVLARCLAGTSGGPRARASA